ncbi:MAG: four helix bundle protein [Sulfuricella sp.]
MKWGCHDSAKIAWQKARLLTKQIYILTASERFSRDYGLKDQIQRAAVSVMSNIAEGFERSGLPEFHQFLVIAKGSCAEVRSQLYIALDIGYISEVEFDEISLLAVEVGKIIGGLRASVKRQI